MIGAARIVIATLMRPVGGSGVQTYLRTCQAYLESVNRPTTVVTPFSSTSPLLYPVFGARMVIRRASPAAGVWWYRYWHARFLAQALRVGLRSHQPAVLYTQCPVSAETALRISDGRPVVMAVHFNISQADEWAGQGELRAHGRMHRSIQRFEERVLPRLDGIVYVSHFAREQVESRVPGAKAVPSVVIHHGLDPVARAPTRPTRDLITVGCLEPRKNHEYLLQILAAAARRGHRYTLTVVGAGPDREQLAQTARRLGVHEQEDLIGHHPDPRSLMPMHRLYCHSAVMESFGIALLEAMSEGLPSATGRVGGIPEILRPGLEGIFWPLDDPAAAAELLIDLMGDRDRLAAMSARAAARASTEFSPSVLGAELLSFLDGVDHRHLATRT